MGTSLCPSAEYGLLSRCSSVEHEASLRHPPKISVCSYNVASFISCMVVQARAHLLNVGIIRPREDITATAINAFLSRQEGAPPSVGKIADPDKIDVARFLNRCCLLCLMCGLPICACLACCCCCSCCCCCTSCTLLACSGYALLSSSRLSTAWQDAGSWLHLCGAGVMPNV